MIKSFGRTFLHLDEAFVSDLRTLEVDGTITSHQFIDELDDFAQVRFRLTPMEIIRYVDGLVSLDQWLEGLEQGVDSDAALQLVTNSAIRTDAMIYEVKNPDTGLCPAAFMGEDLEDLLCFHKGERRQIIGVGYERDRRYLVDEIIAALPTTIDYLSRPGKSGLSAIQFSKEEQIRDLLYTMLRGVFADATIEDPVSKFAGAGKRLDIVIPKISTIIELKFARAQNSSHIVDELKIDIESYHLHRSCDTLICLIWDPHRVMRERDAVVRDLSGSRKINDAQFVVKVRCVP